MKLRSISLCLLVVSFFSCGTDDNLPSIPADFEFSKEMFMVRQEIQFSEVPAGAAKYEWDFGNGITSEERMPRVKYFEPGVYPVTLKIIAPGPTSHQASRDIRIGQYYLNQISLEGIHNEYIISDEPSTDVYIVVSRRMDMDEEEEIARQEGLTVDLNNLPVTLNLNSLAYDAGSEYSTIKIYDASDDSLIAVHDSYYGSAFRDASPIGDFDKEIESSNRFGSRMVFRYMEGE